ncbi:CRISPR-associated exonuclease, Cas4 family [Saccharicrinis carchari]|uniref:CRISPR-associated exonuclease Cas4 n=1 Tax=Saccharicrinis carchari TaxID=1168039 RepID=A0A521E9U5_SACCC|nr:CRISPR-associated protein Cas4 [Saccharicrinis carchari]SMO80679.1 CRISPR-associated exonuclease, Cas4 family [Saccharicrinis carchari]
MQITGTHFNYFLVCKRKLWLFAKGINMEHSSDLVYAGKLIHETSYNQRAEKFKEVELDGIKIDFFDHHNNVVHEIKKSRKEQASHVWQLKYYLFVLQNAGVENATGLLEYPKERKKEEILLSDPDRVRIVEMKEEIKQIIDSDLCPATIDAPKCKKCAYYDFCYSTED